MTASIVANPNSAGPHEVVPLSEKSKFLSAHRGRTDGEGTVSNVTNQTMYLSP